MGFVSTSMGPTAAGRPTNLLATSLMNSALAITDSQALHKVTHRSFSILLNWTSDPPVSWICHFKASCERRSSDRRSFSSASSPRTWFSSMQSASSRLAAFSASSNLLSRSASLPSRSIRRKSASLWRSFILVSSAPRSQLVRSAASSASRRGGTSSAAQRVCASSALTASRSVTVFSIVASAAAKPPPESARRCLASSSCPFNWATRAWSGRASRSASSIAFIRWLCSSSRCFISASSSSRRLDSACAAVLFA
mmetsp:Transcript_40160/g.110393  ORF Transcript_40160/g.110393 Transcript_40160/m.110393 type:complete len:254 (-) Transcript_40160:922-1683(-)